MGNTKESPTNNSNNNNNNNNNNDNYNDDYTIIIEGDDNILIDDNNDNSNDDNLDSDYFLYPGLSMKVFADGLENPRGMYQFENNGSLLVVEKRGGNVLFLNDLSENGFIEEEEKHVLISDTSGLNHAVIMHQNYLYASTSTIVYRWPFDVNTYNGGSLNSNDLREEVVTNMPCCGK